ncbi:MAG: hypothetical protein M0R51_10870 [Clostridia bacterium]|jgi:hypothetical protein|nr:hypothetical protein [Clostridia bacterium]
MTSKERKLRKALKLYGVKEEETIDSFIKDLEAMPDEEDAEPVAAENPKAEAVGETEEAEEKPVENDEPKIDEGSDKAEDGKVADEVSPSGEPSIEEKGDEEAKEVEEEKPTEEVVEELQPEPLEEQPAEPEANELPADEPKAIKFEEMFMSLKAENEELKKANAGYEARLSAVEGIVAALGQKEVSPEAKAFGDAQRESPTGNDYVDVRNDYINKLGGRAR